MPIGFFATVVSSIPVVTCVRNRNLNEMDRVGGCENQHIEATIHLTPSSNHQTMFEEGA